MTKLRPGLALSLVCVVAVAHAVLLFDSPFEDSFITYRYAENFAHGRGLTFNPGEVVEGFTSFGWTLFLAGLSRCAIPLEAASRALSLVFGVALLATTARTFREWTGRRGAEEALPVLVVAASGTWAYYAMTGMETTLFALLVGVGVLFASFEGDRRFSLVAGLALGAAALVRPEGVGYTLAIAAAVVFEKGGWKPALSMMSVFAALFVPYFFWRWNHFGYLLPNAYYAKATASTAIFRHGALQLVASANDHLFWLVPVGLYVLVKRAGWTRGLRIALFLLSAGVANMILVGGDCFLFYRFLLPVMPAAAIVLVGAALSLADSVKRSAHLRRAITAAPVVLTLWVFTAEFRGKTRDWFENERSLEIDRIAVGEWLRVNFPGTLLATNAAGTIPYLSGLETIDMLGVNDVHIAHLPIRLGTGITGHEKHDAKYVLSRRPGVILLGVPTLLDHPMQPAELDATVGYWSKMLPGDQELYADPGFRRDYAPVGAQVSTDRFLLFFLRRELSDGPGTEHR